jgi:hypothetical protein
MLGPRDLIPLRSRRVLESRSPVFAGDSAGAQKRCLPWPSEELREKSAGKRRHKSANVSDAMAGLPTLLCPAGPFNDILRAAPPAGRRLPPVLQHSVDRRAWRPV